MRPWFRLLGTGMVLALGGCEQPAPQPPERLRMEAYVWQDYRRSEVRDAAQWSRRHLAVRHYRAAELAWRNDRFVVQRVVTDQLPEPGCGLVVRIGQSAAGLVWDDAQRAVVDGVVRELAALSPREIQCDYDCPQRRLGTYRQVLHSMRAAAGSIPVLPTVLPSWMGESEFKALALENPGYVLQVHSLQLPESPSESPVVFDPASARRAVERAAEIGMPFRVAMATYGCELCYDRDGRLIEVVSEDSGPEPRQVARRSFAFADPIESARLVESWIDRRPRGLQAVAWFRLPVEGEQRNWPRQTFAMVLQGTPPNGHLELAPVEDGLLCDLFLENRGSGPARLPDRVSLRVAAVAADGVGPYRIASGPAGVTLKRREHAWPWIPPGARVPIAWVRKRSAEGRITWEGKPR